jgi:hypothetical protein
MHAIQRLRQRARANGVLRSNGQQNVYLNGYYIYIVPAQADMMYCPDYDPQVVYSTQYYPNGQLYLSFGAGLTIGAWLSYDMDWRTQRVYNYGWNNGGAGGWRTRSRAHITINNVYNTNINRTVSVNRNVLHRQVNPTRIAHYTLPTRATKTPVSSRRPVQSTTRTTTTRPNVRRNVPTASSRPTPTRTARTSRPSASRTAPSVSTRSGQHKTTKTSPRPSARRNVPAVSHRSSPNKAVKSAAPRHSTSQPKSSHQASGNKGHGNKAAGQQHGSGGNNKNKK